MLETLLPSRAVVPSLSCASGRFRGSQFFHGPNWGGGGLETIQGHYTYYALCFHYYYISCTSGHQALDPGGWGLLF